MSKNVFADLDLPDPKTHLVKAQIVLNLSRIIRAKGTTQAEVAKLAGWSQPRVSQILRGQFQDVSVEKLLDVANALNHNVKIIIDEQPVSEGTGKTIVLLG